MNYIKWCTSHYELSFCNKVKKYLREQGLTVVTRDYVKESGKSYARVYILKNDFYMENQGKINIFLPKDYA